MSSFVDQTTTNKQPTAANLHHRTAIATAPSLAEPRPHTATYPNERLVVGAGLRLFVGLLPVVGLLLGFLFLRVHAIDAHLPYFVDELRHIERSRVVWTFTDLQVSTTPSKFLLYYWIGLFELPGHLPGWLARAPVGMFAMLGAAGMFALARVLFNKTTAYVALALLLALPFMLFYERLALSDPLAATFVVLVAWWSVVYARRPTRRRAAILGVLVCFMLAAKVLAGPLLILPGTAILLVGVKKFESTGAPLQQIKHIFHTYWPTLIVAVLIVAVVWGAILAFYQIRGLVQPQQTEPIVDRYLYEALRRGIGASESGRPVDELWDRNWQRLKQIVVYMWSRPIFYAAVFALPFMMWRKPRRTFYLVSAVALMWGIVLLVAGELSTRYMTLPGHLAIVLVAAGLVGLRDELARWLDYFSFETLKPLAYAPLVILLGWMGLFEASFYQTLVTTPHQLAMPERDKYEYFENQTGYALRDVLNDLADMPPISDGVDMPLVYGMVRNCHFLPNHISSDTPVQIRCSQQYHSWPRRDWPDSVERYTDVEGLVQEYGRIYMIMEQFPDPMIDQWALKAHLRFIASYPRPGNGVPVNLYVVSPRGEIPSGPYVQPDLPPAEPASTWRDTLLPDRRPPFIFG